MTAPSWTTLPADRLRSPPSAGARSAAWATRGSAVALTIAAGVLAWSLLTPLPAPEDPEPPAVLKAPAVAWVPPAAADRERLLAAVNRVNIYAADHEFWPVRSAQETQAAEEERAAAAAPPPPPERPRPASRQELAQRARTGDPSVFDEIELSAAVPPNIEEELKKISLLGVLRVNGGPSALVQNRNKTLGKAGVEQRFMRPGETFNDGSWSLLAIDVPGRRAIVSRGAVNAELRMDDVDLGEAVTVVDPAERARRAEIASRPTAFTLERMEEAAVRAELLESGIDPAEIDEMLRLAREGIAEAEARRAAAESAAGDAAGDDAAVPAGIDTILNLLSSDPFSRGRGDRDRSGGERRSGDPPQGGG